MNRLQFALAIGLCALDAGCSSCKRSADTQDAALPATLEVASGVPVRPWVTTWSSTGVALPVPCKLVSRPVLHPADGEPLVFAAADGEMRSLAVASVPSSGSLPPTRGIVDTSGEDAGTAVRDVPWLDVHAPPVLAASQGRWLALLAQAEPFTPTVRLWLWREGMPIAGLAEGDGLAAIDARCEGEQCGLLTTRAGAVAAAGATLWTGAWAEPAGAWKRTDLAGGVVPADAKAFSIARFSGPRDATVAFESASGVIFTRQAESGLELVGRVDRDDALLDVAMAGSTPVAVSMRGRADEHGCAPSAAIVVRAPGREPMALPLTALPLAGYARSVGTGMIVAWIQPVDCKTNRRVVNAIAFDSVGMPVGSMVSIADADGFAMASAGDLVRMWFRDPSGVTQLDARCSMPAPR